jgi:hypothetical protein
MDNNNSRIQDPVETLEVSVQENSSVLDNLFNYKRWFNGLKKFTSIKVPPPYDNTPLS